VELFAARAVLGVTADDGWEVIRATYREQIRLAHPDVAGEAGTGRAVELNAAYRTLALARREGRLHDPPPPPAGPAPGGHAPVSRRAAWAPGSGPPDDVRLLTHDTIVLSSPPEETFRRLVEAAHAVGEISYLDRSSAIFEAILPLDDGSHGSLVVSLQWRAHDATCEAFCTLEALERAEHLDVSGVLGQLIDHIPPDRTW
jgi:hypothetical protein